MGICLYAAILNLRRATVSIYYEIVCSNYDYISWVDIAPDFQNY